MKRGYKISEEQRNQIIAAIVWGTDDCDTFETKCGRMQAQAILERLFLLNVKMKDFQEKRIKDFDLVADELNYLQHGEVSAVRGDEQTLSVSELDGELDLFTVTVSRWLFNKLHVAGAKFVDRIKSHPACEDVFSEPDNMTEGKDDWWIHLKAGWCCDDELHIIHTQTLREAHDELMNYVIPCLCKQCVAALAKKIKSQ